MPSSRKIFVNRFGEPQLSHCNMVGETGFEPATSCSQSRAEPRRSAALSVNQAKSGSLEINALQQDCKPTAFELMHAGDDGWSDWIHPLPGYLMKCCDCGLVHEMEVAIGETDAATTIYNSGEGPDRVVLFRMRREQPA